jgi:hypothetical protein
MFIRATRFRATVSFVGAAVIVASTTVAAQTPPAPDPSSPLQHIFYGATPPDDPEAPVILFVHGPNGVASDWWMPPNDMYALAFSAGYRTAFVNMNEDGSPDFDGIQPNALLLRTALPAMLARFQVQSLYIVAHSKGGLDVQGAMLDPAFATHVKAVFTIGTPNQGTELADWAFGGGQAGAASLGLLSPAVFSMQTSVVAQLRALADPTLAAAGVPFYTVAGTSFTTPANPLLSATGPVLSSLTGGQPNDGIVSVARSTLPATYAFDLGSVPVNHFAVASGRLVFPRINAQIRALEGTRAFRRIASDGFALDGTGLPLGGDFQNSFPWSAQWFKGKLYVGTARASVCVSLATQDAALGTNTYATADPIFQCPADPKDIAARAEIWRYTPETGVWERVYQSPQDVPVAWNEDGTPTKFTARDIGYRGMSIFHENAGVAARRPAPGLERLYVGAVSASSLFDTLPEYADGSRAFPPPRLLWTADGTTWHEVPQTPGTFFGDINVQNETVKKRGFRSFASVRDARGVNHLFVTLTDLRGIGRVLVSTEPSRGDNAWREVSPSADDFPVFTLHNYRNQLYATVTLGGVAAPYGYGVFRTDLTADPLNPGRMLFTPVVLPTGTLQYPPRASISMQEFQGSLYVGSDRPTELIRIHPDDSWDLLVGTPRMTDSGLKEPLSGIGSGFNSIFNGHFYSMAVQGDTLFLGTWDWSENLYPTILHGVVRHENGFDLLATRDGITWSVVSRTGLGDSSSAIVRNMIATPHGLFVGSANLRFGLEMFQNHAHLDLNGDGVIDRSDVAIVLAASISRASGPNDPRDLDGDGRITWQDARLLQAYCDNPLCAPSETPPILPPATLAAAPVSPSAIALGWTASSRAVRYHVFRADPVLLDNLLPSDMSFPLPFGGTVTVEDIRNGALDALCLADASEASLCAMVEALRSTTLMMRRARWIGSTTDLTFVDTAPLAPAHAFYHVVAEDARGRLSDPTHIVRGVQMAVGGDPVDEPIWELPACLSRPLKTSRSNRVPPGTRPKTLTDDDPSASPGFGVSDRGNAVPRFQLPACLLKPGRTPDSALDPGNAHAQPRLAHPRFQSAVVGAAIER